MVHLQDSNYTATVNAAALLGGKLNNNNNNVVVGVEGKDGVGLSGSLSSSNNNPGGILEGDNFAMKVNHWLPSYRYIHTRVSPIQPSNKLRLKPYPNHTHPTTHQDMQRALASHSITSTSSEANATTGIYASSASPTLTRAASLSLGKERVERVASAGRAVRVGVAFCGRCVLDGWLVVCVGGMEGWRVMCVCDWSTHSINPPSPFPPPKKTTSQFPGGHNVLAGLHDFLADSQSTVVGYVYGCVCVCVYLYVLFACVCVVLLLLCALTPPPPSSGASVTRALLLVLLCCAGPVVCPTERRSPSGA